MTSYLGSNLIEKDDEMSCFGLAGVVLSCCGVNIKEDLLCPVCMWDYSYWVHITHWQNLKEEMHEKMSDKKE
jgi:hypothetical protein